jgi:serine protease Do
LAQDDLAAREEQAMKAAVEQVAPSVVRVETVGGLERVGRVLFGTGPTTGLVLTSDGYIVSSAFNFAQKPTSILIGLPDGTRTPARLVATDHNRMLVLLKVETREPLVPAEFVPENEMQVGQWAIAVGRTFEGGEPNLSVGIVSALKRIWGKAIQTDAKISPSNYGGPLVDIRGRVLGVLVPMAPQGTGALAGFEWFDSGIGFAVPLEHVHNMLPRWKESRDLLPGILGISMKPGNAYADPAVIAACRSDSPAYKAGLRAGDTIVEIDGQPIVRQTQVKEQVTHRYAGETVRVVALRDKQRIEAAVELVEKLDPYQFPFLGILPMRSPPVDGQGVAVRHVFADSPAAKAGVQPGDVIASFGGKPVASRGEVFERISELEPRQKAVLELRRGSETIRVELEAGKLPEEIPAQLPPALEPRDPPAERPQVGLFELKIVENKNDCQVYVPESYHPEVPHGVVIWLSADGSFDRDEFLARWKPLAERDGLIVLAPQSGEPADAQARRAWQPSNDLPFIGKLLDQVAAGYNIDRARVVAHGHQGGGALAYALAFSNRDFVRGVAAVDAPMAGRPPENEPIYRLAFYMTKSTKGSRAAAPAMVDAVAQRLRAMLYPVTVKDLGEQSSYLDDEQLAELARWIDTLDRF